MTTVEWLLPLWVAAVVIILAILSRMFRTLTPLKQYASSSQSPNHAASFTAVGGLRCPSTGRGTINITTPLVRLACYDSELRLGPSIRPLGLLVPRWTFPYAAVERAEPVKGPFLGSGVRLWVSGTPVVFLTFDPRRVLNAIEARGVAASGELGKTAWRSVG